MKNINVFSAALTYARMSGKDLHWAFDLVSFVAIFEVVTTKNTSSKITPVYRQHNGLQPCVRNSIFAGTIQYNYRCGYPPHKHHPEQNTKTSVEEYYRGKRFVSTGDPLSPLFFNLTIEKDMI